MDKQLILQKIQRKELVLGVVGLGYVGLPMAVEMAKSGYRTIGFDIQSKKVARVNAGDSYIKDINEKDIKSVVNGGKFTATTDFTQIAKVDFLVICVPTPLDEHQQPDISYVQNSAEAISHNMKSGMIVVLESTTYPGTTDGLVRSILEDGSNLKCGEDFYLGFSPERVDPGNKQYKTKNTPKVVGGIGKDATKIIAAVYRSILQSNVYEVSSPAVAEMEKILENTYRNINIALVNELAMFCHRSGISIWEVVEAAKTKPYGFQAFYPGPGVGGHCIPLDPGYLAWKAREYGFHTSMIEASSMINDRMPEYCVTRCSEILNCSKKAINGSKVLILGVAYKNDIADYRESPALLVIESFERRGADIAYFDPWVKQYTYKEEVHYTIPQLTKEVLQKADIVVIMTAHTSVDYDFVQQNSKFIFDARNAMKNVKNRDNIEVL